MESKLCSKCRRGKPRSDFNKNLSRADGLQHRCRACAAEERKAYVSRNREKFLKSRREWYERNAEGERARSREFRRAFYASSPEKVLAANARYRKKRESEDPLFKAAGKLRSLTYDAFRRKGFSKSSRTAALLGCDFETAKAHIEGLFKAGMSWENHGAWHLDHVVPLASASCVRELEELCHYSNLQPLWAEENILKGAKP